MQLSEDLLSFFFIIFFGNKARLHHCSARLKQELQDGMNKPKCGMNVSVTSDSQHTVRN